ncbi:class I SAM-dependent methyltransferase [Spirosoma sp. KCTC 42546]|uniref:class I SAM-dependent DNA methyltransferase n=1 Tax=Spirosoma sp. KCTC 42546 TaxID=2520506 RepID=UPI001158D3AB|nr:class I SAM-dependent methyltransferase [Spirosoma sp. KCTC 42546]QDK78208.1 class I SAM-dependent methyltransferase [Spirosoma sp. KCTC 42546]
MIGRSEEYAKMFQLEGQLWWYRSLHERVEQALQTQFGSRRDIRILDAGCGTGGMLDFLRHKGYTILQGIDGSADAVEFCHERGFSVTLLDLTKLASFEPEVQYDVIICNDVFCYFTEADLPPLLSALRHRLKSNGILVSNNNAFSVFEGQHDIAVGIIRRFVLADFEYLLPQAGLIINYATYWSFVLSPVILLIRQWQRLQLKLGWQKPEDAKSDVYLPSAWINETLYHIAKTEQKLLSRTPFGSSLFIIVGKS